MTMKGSPPEGLGGYAITDGPADRSPDIPDDVASQKEKLDRARQVLEAGFRTYQTSAILTTFGLLGAACSLGFSQRRIELAHVELATAFALHFPAGTSVPEAPALRELADALETYVDIYPHLGWEVRNDPKSRAAAVRRHHTFRVRHTAYPYEEVAIFERIVRELRTDTSVSLGTSMERALFFVQQSGNSVAKRIVESGGLEPFVEWLETTESVFDGGWTTMFDIQASEIEAHRLAGFDVGAVAEIVRRLVLKPGDLTLETFEHLHLGNPVRNRPLVELNGRIFCFSPSSICDSQADILENLLFGSVKNVRERLGKARGDALEAMAGETLRRMLPNAEVLEGAHWTDPRDGRDYETDIIVIIDDVVFVFEAKSNVVSATSRRGSNSWFGDLDDIVLKACEQAGRLSRLLADPSGKAIRFDGEFGTRIIDPGTVKGVLKFGLSLERVTFGSSTPGSFLHDRIDAAGLDPMPILTIGDLWQIEKLVDNEAQRFHYLLRRAQLDHEQAFVADEQDLLALYLLNGFNDPEMKGRTLDAYGLSANLRYHQPETPHHDPRVRLPTLITPLWRHLIAQSEKIRKPSWRMIAYDLLHFAVDEQQKFREDLVLAKREVRQNGRKGVVVNAVQKFSIRHPVRLVCVTGAKVQSPDFKREVERIWTRHQARHHLERAIILTQDLSSGRAYPSLARYHGTRWQDEGMSYDETGNPRTAPKPSEIDRSSD